MTVTNGNNGKTFTFIDHLACGGQMEKGRALRKVLPVGIVFARRIPASALWQTQESELWLRVMITMVLAQEKTVTEW